jgi:glycosyltransferase involved in cell wall biosynthesis
MFLIIQIPCFNEERTLADVIRDLPGELPGISRIEIQVVNDGSLDNTVAVARACGVEHVILFKKNKGLAAAFKAGVDNALALGADIVVNTDADNQYFGGDIGRLVEPIVKGQADIVIGCRPISDHPEFSPFKKILQKVGSWVLRKVSNTAVRDAASGFRAYSRNAMLHMNVYSQFSYCMETLIQAGLNNLKIESVDIRVNPKTRESRLFSNLFQYVWKQGKTITSIFILYRASFFFNAVAAVIFLFSAALVVRYVVLTVYYKSPSNAFWPSIIFAGILFAIAFQVFLTGILSSLVSSLRKLTEEVNYRLKRVESSLDIDRKENK